MDCEDGRDEAEHCPFSSTACKGWVAFRNHCYRYVSRQALGRTVEPKRSHIQAASFCAPLNASTAIIKNGDSLFAIVNIFKLRVGEKRYAAITFSYGSLSVPNMCRNSLIALDKTVIHHSLTMVGHYRGRHLCFNVNFRMSRLFSRLYKIHAISCSDTADMYYYSWLGTIYGLTTSSGGFQEKEVIRFTNTSFFFF